MGWPDGHPELGDYAGVREAALVMVRVVEWLGEVDRALQGAGRGASMAWEGEAASAFLDKVSATSSVMSENVVLAQEAVEALRLVIAEVGGYVIPEAKKTQLAKSDAEADLAVAEGGLAMDRLVNPLTAQSGPEARRVRLAASEVEAAVHKLRMLGEYRTSEVDVAARKLARIEFRRMNSYANGSSGVVALGFPVAGAGFEVPGFWSGDLSGCTPEQIRAEWDKLATDAERQAAIESDPMLFGNLDGIPLGWRANANEINIRNEITRLQAEIRELQATAINQSIEDSVDPRVNTQIGRLQKLVDEYETLLGTAKYDSRDPESWRTAYFDENGDRVGVGDSRRANWPPGSQVIVFDPSQGAIATYHGVFTKDGDIPSGYDSVGMYVPGTGTNIEGWRTGADMRGSQLHVGCNNSGLGSQAMIVYSGTAQPQTIPEAMAPGFAQTMGPAMAQFANTYVPEDPDFTVMGHSYGATDVAQAEACGMKADRVLYVAPAGYGEAPESFPREEIDGVPSKYGGIPGGTTTPFLGLEDFPETGDNPHYVMISRNDAVVGIIQNDPFNIHGDSPTHDPNVIRLETGFIKPDQPEMGYVDDAPLFDNHSSPFWYGSTAQQNMVQVFMGGTAQGWGGESIHKDPDNWAGGSAFVDQPYKNEEDWPDVTIK